MRLAAALTGNLKKMMEEEVRVASRSITESIEEVSGKILSELRAETSGALGTRVANAWRRKRYPQGRDSMAAAGWIYTKAPNIISAFAQSQLIRSNKGMWLAIPGPGCPVRVGRKKPTPAMIEAMYRRPLEFVYRPGKPALLVMRDVTASYSRRTGQLRGFRNLSEKRRAAGRGGASIIMFFLVPAVRTRRLIDIDSKISAAETELPAIMVRNWERLSKADFIGLGE